jgi:YegS/Rv2252/BmrU family lipid kinase
MKKFLFVLNPISGGKKKDRLIPLIYDFCKNNSIHQTVFTTTGNGNDKARLRELILENSLDAVIAVGGDGTVNFVGEILVTTGIPLGIIPMGSANGLARDLGIPEDPAAALDLIKNFHIHPIDTLKVNGIHCFHVTDFGFNANIVRRFHKSLLRGKISYGWYGIQEFFSFRPFAYTIKTDQFIIQGKAFMITVTNANRFGTNVNINPLGEIDDGFFEISIIKPFSKFKSFEILYHLFSNSIHRSNYNRVIRCKFAEIHNLDKTSVHIDGEPVAFKEQIDIEIIPKGLQIIMPKIRIH